MLARWSQLYQPRNCTTSKPTHGHSTLQVFGGINAFTKTHICLHVAGGRANIHYFVVLIVKFNMRLAACEKWSDHVITSRCSKRGKNAKNTRNEPIHHKFTFSFLITLTDRAKPNVILKHCNFCR